MSTTSQTPQVKLTPWSAEQLCINSISILGSDGETELASIIGEDEVGEEEWSRARLMAAAPDMLAALHLDATADKLERDDPEQSQMAIASFREAAKEARKAAIAKAERSQ